MSTTARQSCPLSQAEHTGVVREEGHTCPSQADQLILPWMINGVTDVVDK